MGTNLSNGTDIRAFIRTLCCVLEILLFATGSHAPQSINSNPYAFNNDAIHYFNHSIAKWILSGKFFTVMLYSTRHILIFGAVLYAAYTDYSQAVIDDRATTIIFICAPHHIALGYGLSLAFVFDCMRRKTERIGQGDCWLLGSLSSVMDSQHFLLLCLGSTTLLMILTRVLGSRAYPMAPIFLVVLVSMARAI